MKHLELKTRPRSFQHICVKLISRTDGSILVQVTEAAGDWRWFMDPADRSPECVVTALHWVLNVQ